MDFPKATIEVTCALIRHDEKFLVTQRGPKMKMPFLWEFPGGKIEPGETPENGIIREIKEELAIEIALIHRLPDCKYEYEEFAIVLIPFVANYLSGEMQLTEHQSFKWLKADELNLPDLAPADVAVVKELVHFLENS